jgi:hypothetical protein
MKNVAAKNLGGIFFSFGAVGRRALMGICSGYPLYLRYAAVPLLSRSPSAENLY